MEKRVDRTGEENYNSFGTLMKIVEYVCYDNIWVEFQDEHKTKIHASYQMFKKGEVRNPYDKTVYGVGYLGEGKYKAWENKKQTKVYITWVNMLKRCYDPYYINKEPTYINCIVCDEWLNFQNFAKWYYKNVYNCNDERMHLDKDILVKGNKIYSPDTCIIIPHRINVLFIKSDKARGKYPIGVHYNKASEKLLVQCNVYENRKKKQKYLGSFPLNRPFQAFYTYKIFKEKVIKQVADEYKDLIPEKLYNAMYEYEVEITD